MLLVIFSIKSVVPLMLVIFLTLVIFPEVLLSISLPSIVPFLFFMVLLLTYLLLIFFP